MHYENQHLNMCMTSVHRCQTINVIMCVCKAYNKHGVPVHAAHLGLSQHQFEVLQRHTLAESRKPASQLCLVQVVLSSPVELLCKTMFVTPNAFNSTGIKKIFFS